MIDIRTQILTVAAAAAFMILSFFNPAFAAEQGSVQNKGWGEAFESLIDELLSRKYTVLLDGEQEVSEKFDIDGIGQADIKIREDKHELCASIEASYIDQASSAHIHYAPAKATGVVVINLPIPDEHGKSEGCLEVDQTLLKKIIKQPEYYYINIITNSYPDGAIRGQLSS